MHILARLALVILPCLVVGPSGAFAQSPPTKPAQKAPASSVPPAVAASQAVAMPGAEAIVTLIRTSLLTLNDALKTGNFTVFRDASAPSFREKNSAHRLSQIFANLVSQQLDLSAVAVMVPELVDPPSIDQRTGLLRIRGRYTTQQLGLEFELNFQNVKGAWLLFGISVVPTGTAAPQ